MKRILLFALFFLLPATALGQDKMTDLALAASSFGYESPRPNTCKGVGSGGKWLWMPCPLSWQKEIIQQGKSENVAPGSLAFLQDVAANKTVINPPKTEEKTKPVIIPAAKMQELAALRKDLQLALLNIENAQLKIKELNTIIETAKGDGQKAKALEAEFWRKLGINPEELPTKWEASDGQNGDIILKRKEEPAEKPKP